MRVDVVVGTRFSNRACSSFGNCTSLRAITEGEPRLVRTCSSFGNCTSLRGFACLDIDTGQACSSFGNCTSLREKDAPMRNGQFRLAVLSGSGLWLLEGLQFFRELHFIEGAHQCAHNRMCGLQFFRELHFIEGRLSGGGFKPPCPCSSFGNCTSLRAWDHSVARTRLSIHSIIDR